MSNFINRIDKILIFIAGIGVIGLMILISIGVITRYFFGFSIPAAYAITENYLMPLAIFPVLGYAFKSGVFPNVDLLIENIKSVTIKKILNSINLVIEFLLFAFITYYIFQYTIYSIENGNGFSANGYNFLIYPVYILMTFSFLWLSVSILIKFLELHRYKYN